MSYSLLDAQNTFTYLQTLFSCDVVGSTYLESAEVNDLDVLVLDTDWSTIKGILDSDTSEQILVPLHFFLTNLEDYNVVKTALRTGNAIQSRKLIAGRKLQGVHYS